jgi:hypothetical protein
MHRFAPLSGLFVTACLLVSGTNVSHSQQPSAEEDHTKWVAAVLNQIETIKPGMTRGDLTKTFREEGGLSTRSHGKYVFKGCPYIKVDVVFTSSDNDQLTENRIVSISRAYLEYTVWD